MIGPDEPKRISGKAGRGVSNGLNQHLQHRMGRFESGHHLADGPEPVLPVEGLGARARDGVQRAHAEHDGPTLRLGQELGRNAPAPGRRLHEQVLQFSRSSILGQDGREADDGTGDLRHEHERQVSGRDFPRLPQRPKLVREVAPGD